MVRRVRALIETAWAVQQRYRLDAGDQLAAAIAYFAFISFVPLLLLAVSVAGFVLSDPDAQVRVALELTKALPGFEDTVDEPDSTVRQLLATVVDARGTVGLIGLATLLFTGLKVVAALMTATRVVFRGQLLSGVMARLRQLLALLALGIMALAAVGASSLAATGLLAELPAALTLSASLLLSLLLDLALFLTAYTVLSPSAVLRPRQLLPGALLAAVGWTLLKVVSSTVVAGQIESANALYGALGSVFALLLLLYLAGRLYLYGAELSAVLVEAEHGPLEQLHGPTVLPPPPTERLAALTGRDSRDTAASEAHEEPEEPEEHEAPREAAPAVPAASSDPRRTLAIVLGGAALVTVWRWYGGART